MVLKAPGPLGRLGQSTVYYVFISDAMHGVPTAFVGTNCCVSDGRDVSMEHPLVMRGEGGCTMVQPYGRVYP